MALYDPSIRTVYNFSYRLSGNHGAARKLTETALLKHFDNPCDNSALLKQVWKDYLKYYENENFKGKDTVQQVLLTLSPKLRCLVILRNVLGCSYPQISTILDIPEKDISSLIGEGMGLVRKHLN